MPSTPADAPVRVRRCGTRTTLGLLTLAIVGVVGGRAGLFGAKVSTVLIDATEALRSAHPVAVAVAIGFSLVSVLNRGRMHQEAHHCVELSARLVPMVLVSSAAYALNKIAKAAGAGGIALFVRHGNRHDRSSGSVTAAYMVASVCAQLGLGLIVASAFLTALRDGSPGRIWIGTVAGLGVWMFITAVVMGLVLRSRDRVRSVVALGMRALGWVARRFGRSGPSTEAAVVDDFFDAVLAVRRNPQSFFRTLCFATVDKLLGALALTYALMATGASTSFTTVLQAFAVGLVASTVAVLPAGVGAVEASMVALLAQRGVDLPTASAAVVIFRLIDLWVPLAFGSVAARHLVGRVPRGTETAAPETAAPEVLTPEMSTREMSTPEMSTDPKSVTVEPVERAPSPAGGAAMSYDDLLKPAPDSAAQLTVDLAVELDAAARSRE